MVCTSEFVPQLTKRNQELEHKLTVEDSAKNELIKKNEQVSLQYCLKLHLMHTTMTTAISRGAWFECQSEGSGTEGSSIPF